MLKGVAWPFPLCFPSKVNISRFNGDFFFLPLYGCPGSASPWRWASKLPCWEWRASRSSWGNGGAISIGDSFHCSPGSRCCLWSAQKVTDCWDLYLQNQIEVNQQKPMPSLDFFSLFFTHFFFWHLEDKFQIFSEQVGIFIRESPSSNTAIIWLISRLNNSLSGVKLVTFQAKHTYTNQFTIGMINIL